MRGCHKLLFLMFTSLLALNLAALSLESINATDEGKYASNINIDLSGAAVYRVESSSGSLQHRIIISNTQASQIRPDYKRLSPVIDRISYSQEGANTVISIRSMKPSQLSHSQSGSSISLRLVLEGSSPANSGQTKASKPSPSPSSDGEQKKAQTPEPDKKTPIPQAVPTSPPSIQADSLSQPDSLVSLPAATEASKEEINWRGMIRQYRYWGFALLGMIAVIAIFILFRSIRTKAQYSAREAEEPMLIMDSDTRQRMVMRLTEQGWKPEQIATELRMPVRNVQRIISQSRKKL